MAGFLPFNYPRARIFMGDVGSQGAGLLLGALALLLGRHGPWGLWAALIPMTLFGILWDVGFTLCRRARAGERLTEAHRGHLYQVTSRSGVSRPAVAAIHWLFCVWGGLAWLGLALLPPEWKTAAALLVLPPQIGWTMLVRRLARRAGLARWS
jgi:UDP-GlcNAc:undecaprenyl-phosphate/decaprenyl-phosphate GlcNAc-1-phosphate transferase